MEQPLLISANTSGWMGVPTARISRITDITMVMSDRSRPWSNMEAGPEPMLPPTAMISAAMTSARRSPALLEAARGSQTGPREG